MTTPRDSATLFVGASSRQEGYTKGVYAFQFNARTGALQSLGIQAEIGSRTYLCGTKSSLYVAHECSEPLASDPSILTGYVSAFGIGENGQLTLLNRRETRGSLSCHVSVSSAEDFIAVSNYGGGSVALYPINVDGSLADLSDFHQYSGGSLVVPDRQDVPRMHSATWVPHTNYVFVADLGNDRIAQFELDKDAKKLVPNATAAFLTRPAGSGPRHLAIHAPLKVAYVVDELANTIGVHSYETTTGTLSADSIQSISTLPSGFAGTSSSSDIHVSTCGNFVYASNRGHDSIAMYRVDKEASGKLELIGFESARGKSPRNFLIFRDFLLAAHQNTNTIEVFRIDASNGKLAHTGVSAECPGPVSLFIAPQ